MLSDSAFDLVGQMSVRPTDQMLDLPLHFAVMRLRGPVEDAPQNVTEPLPDSSHRCAGGTVPLHGSGYREPAF
jgi:hypothetical protein